MVINIYLGVDFIAFGVFCAHFAYYVKAWKSASSTFLYYLKSYQHASCMIQWTVESYNAEILRKSIFLSYFSWRVSHYNDVTWAQCPKSPITPLFLQQLNLTDNNRIINAPHHWPFVRANHQLLIKSQLCGKYSYVMTSSCIFSTVSQDKNT